MRTDLQILNDKLDKILFLLEAKPLARPAAAPRQAARGQALADHDEKWNRVKETWPQFRVHPKSCEAFTRHSATLDHNPELRKIQGLARKLKNGRYYTRQILEAEFSMNYEKAQACLYFLKIAGLGTYVDKKGLLVTAEALQDSAFEE